MPLKEGQNIIRDGERRQATVLFADISGFTNMSEKMDPEEVHQLLNECFKIMGSIIDENEGTIDKFIGDCVMALFGIPAAIEGAPRKAINTAIEMRNRIDQFNRARSLKIPLRVHVGINTGMVITGSIGSDKKKEYTVMGDTVNVASRLKNISKSGQIFVGPTTYRLAKDAFYYKKLDPIAIKGKQEPFVVYELLSEKEKVYRTRLGRERMIASEMVGRDKELSILSQHLSKVINGEGSIVSIVGEAGIGKSRLITEFRKKDEVKQVVLLVGRALSIGKNLSSHPIIDILKHWAGIKEDDEDKVILLKLERTIRNIHPDGTEEIIPIVATLMGINLSGKYAEWIKGIEGDALEKLILKNLYTLIEKGTSIRPVVLIMEDLHWSDLTTIEFLESLYRLSMDHRILFINILRPGYADTGDRLMKNINERYSDIHTEINLVTLPDSASGELIGNLLKMMKNVYSQILSIQVLIIHNL